MGSIFSGLFGSSSASKAAQQQIAAENQAAGTIRDTAGQAVGEQQNILGQNQANYAPYLGAGATATGLLSEMTGTPGQGLLTPWTNTFTAPTAKEVMGDPQTQAQLQLGEQALQNSAAARGGLLSGGTLADMNAYAQQVASQNYQQHFNNALTQYNSAYNTFQNNQNNTYNRLFGLSNQGLSATGQMGNLNQMGAANIGNILTGEGSNLASLYGQRGAAQAAGTLGVGSSLSTMFGNLSNTAAQYGMLNQMNPNNWNSSAPGSPQTGAYTAGFPTGPYNPNYQPPYVMQ